MHFVNCRGQKVGMLRRIQNAMEAESILREAQLPQFGPLTFKQYNLDKYLVRLTTTPSIFAQPD
jgi:hypothetical protein